MEQAQPLLRFLFLLANPTVDGRRVLSRLLVVHDHFLQLELPAVLLAEGQATLAGDRVSVEVGEHMGWG